MPHPWLCLRNPHDPLSNLARLLERPKALQERIFARLFEQAEVARFTPQERNEYVASKKEYWDSYSVVTTSFNKGLAEGREEERRENVQEKLESARTLKASGVSLEVIVKSLHLTDDEAAVF